MWVEQLHGVGKRGPVPVQGPPPMLLGVTTWLLWQVGALHLRIRENSRLLEPQNTQQGHGVPRILYSSSTHSAVCVLRWVGGVSEQAPAERRLWLA